MYLIDGFFCFADTYDCVVSSGGYGENHLPVCSVDESLRVLKKGETGGQGKINAVPLCLYFALFDAPTRKAT